MAMRPRSRLISQGLSLLEVIASVLIVTIALTAITPAITLAVLSRLHSERVETGNFLAQQEIERIRSLVDKGSAAYTTTDLPAIPGTADFSLPYAGVLGPGSLTATGVGDILCWDQNNPDTLIDCSTVPPGDFGENVSYVVQLFRDQGQPCLQPPPTVTPFADNRPCVFSVGVRVYFYQAFQGTVTVGDDIAFAEPVGALATSGSFSAVKQSPLAALYTEVIASETYSLRDLCRQQTGGAGPCPP